MRSTRPLAWDVRAVPYPRGRGEGLVTAPVPLEPRVSPAPGRLLLAALKERGAPPCEICGAPVVASHGKRICLRCGFMTGCSEDI